MAQSQLKLYAGSTSGIYLGALNMTFYRSGNTFYISTSTFACARALRFTSGSGDITITFKNKFANSVKTSGERYDWEVTTNTLGVEFYDDRDYSSGTHTLPQTASTYVTRTRKSVSARLDFLDFENDSSVNPGTRVCQQGSSYPIYYAARGSSQNFLDDQYAYIASDHTVSGLRVTVNGTSYSVVAEDSMWIECDGDWNDSSTSGTATVYDHYNSTAVWTRASGDCLSTGQTVSLSSGTHTGYFNYTIKTYWNGSSNNTAGKHLGINLDGTGFGDNYSSPYTLGVISEVITAPTISAPSSISMSTLETSHTFSITIGNVVSSCIFYIFAKRSTDTGFIQVDQGYGSQTRSITLTNLTSSVTSVQWYVTSSSLSSSTVTTTISWAAFSLTVDMSSSISPGGTVTANYECDNMISDWTLTANGTQIASGSSSSASGTWTSAAQHFVVPTSTYTVNFVLTCASTSQTVQCTASLPSGCSAMPINNTWYYARPYIYRTTDNQWHVAEAWVYNGRSWSKTKT